MGSCLSRASSGGFANPVVNTKSCEVRGMSLQGVSMDATLVVENHNVMSMEATEIKYEIAKASDGTPMAEGVVDRRFTIRARGSTEVVVPVTFGYMGIGGAGMSLINRGETMLNVSGDMTFVAPLAEKGTLAIPFKGECIIVLEEQPPV